MSIQQWKRVPRPPESGTNREHNKLEKKNNKAKCLLANQDMVGIEFLANGARKSSVDVIHAGANVSADVADMLKTLARCVPKNHASARDR